MSFYERPFSSEREMEEHLRTLREMEHKWRGDRDYGLEQWIQEPPCKPTPKKPRKPRKSQDQKDNENIIKAQKILIKEQHTEIKDLKKKLKKALKDGK